MSISVQLMGGLGNQLFQMATCIGTAKRNDMSYCIPKQTLNDKVWKPYHFEKLNYCDRIGDTCIINEKNHSYNEIIIPMHCNSVMLKGYYQSEKYFQEYRKEILELFGFDNLKTNKDVCSIHVRRADYLLYPKKHPVVSQKYLILAIEQMEIKAGNKKYLMFSDDMEWCKNFFRNISAYSGDKKIGDIEFEFSENNDEITDLKLMAECEHNIIANSTYSWWGAWLNNNTDKIVITPDEDNWFGAENKKLDVSDLIPKEWLKIKY